MADAQEHRRRAESLLHEVRLMQCDMSRQRDDASILQALTAAQVHATLYLGDLFATEFDPRSVPARADEPAPVRPLRSTP